MLKLRIMAAHLTSPVTGQKLEMPQCLSGGKEVKLKSTDDGLVGSPMSLKVSKSSREWG